MKKKVLMMLLVVSMLALTLTGCGKTDDNGGATNGGEAERETLTVWSWDPTFNG